MTVPFKKMNGCGNDFVMIDAMSRPLDITPDQVAFLCDRHFGIGADGVILVEPPKTPRSVAFMNYINSDGSFAQMCGNGVRCFAKFLVDEGIYEGEGPIDVDTRAGVRTISFVCDQSGKLESATVDMGAPILEPSEIPVKVIANATSEKGIAFGRDVSVDSPWGRFDFTFVSMGNPHAVCFIESFESLPDDLFVQGIPRSMDSMKIDEIGAFFESNPIFPEKSNIEFVHIEDAGIRMRVFERGCGETLACGTGACATVVAASLTGRSCGHDKVILNGGVLDISWDGGHVSMTGPASFSFSGEVEI